MNKKIADYISALLLKTEQKGLKLADEREINFGVQLKFTNQFNEIPVNIYYSEKKGITSVIGGSPTNKLRPLLQKILNLEVDEQVADHGWEIWAGTDESGKGDFFGPLTVCGFICNKAMLSSLKNLGVKDSKLLRDAEIETVAKQLYARFMPNIETIVLSPLKYNELYQKFISQNKKLNELLAWMHTRVILNLQKKHSFQGAVVDRFASDHILRSSLKDFKQIQLLHKFKGEEDLGVAAASIIARYLFLKNLKDLAAEFDIELPKGASNKVIEAAERFVVKHGKARLSEVAKLHFKTYQQLKG